LVADKEINLNQEVVDLFCIKDPMINQTFIVIVMKNEFVITDENFTLKNSKKIDYDVQASYC